VAALCPWRTFTKRNRGQRPTSGWRADAGSERFMVQPLPPNFCWQRLQTRPPGGRSGHAIGFSDQWRNQWQTRRRMRALFRAREGKRSTTAIGAKRPFNLIRYGHPGSRPAAMAALRAEWMSGRRNTGQRLPCALARLMPGKQGSGRSSPWGTLRQASRPLPASAPPPAFWQPGGGTVASLRHSLQIRRKFRRQGPPFPARLPAGVREEERER
jgi:hypothetical protein